MEERDYSYYRRGKTGYMDQVLAYLGENSLPNSKILDIPAGSGVFAHALEQLGHEVVKADIHGKAGFVHAKAVSHS
ncbi:MAG: hypothetical protein GAK41_01684 [Burkholderia gladioli]|nr:MAG: hypothetical protein GAK41_01684 [Burkholderia gladioli]